MCRRVARGQAVQYHVKVRAGRFQEAGLPPREVGPPHRDLRSEHVGDRREGRAAATRVGNGGDVDVGSGVGGERDEPLGVGHGFECARARPVPACHKKW